MQKQKASCNSAVTKDKFPKRFMWPIFQLWTNQAVSLQLKNM